jgi:hypothetical protein
LMRHAAERARIYKDKGFPYKRFKVKLWKTVISYEK